MNFMKYKWLYFLLSAVVILPGIFSLVKWGLRPAIDFTGGTILELRFKQPSGKLDNFAIEKVLKDKNISFSSVQPSGEKTYLLRLGEIDREGATQIKTILEEKIKEVPEELRFETVGPILGRELLTKTILAVILAALFILLYVAWVFKNKMFEACAVLAMFHDSLVLLGTFSLLGHFRGVEIDTLFVTAMLTILSFSVHDTVVVYDRIRESQKHFPQAPFVDLVNKAVTETLSRSLNNSLTIIFMLLALWLLGGETIKWFIFALLIGTVSGTYSSTFTAAPLLVVWSQLKKKKP